MDGLHQYINRKEDTEFTGYQISYILNHVCERILVLLGSHRLSFPFVACPEPVEGPKGRRVEVPKGSSLITHRFILGTFGLCT